MRQTIRLLALALMVGLLALSCATPPEPTPPADPEPSSIEALGPGFEPGAEPAFATLGFELKYGSASAVQTWTVSIVGPAGAVRTFKGSSEKLETGLVWDGKDEAGGPAPEGRYLARLELDYGEAFNPGRAESKDFLLVRTPPSISFSPNPALFPYAPEGEPSSLSLELSPLPGLAALRNWILEIRDPEGQLFATLKGTATDLKPSWSGKSETGAAMVAGSSYPALLSIYDEFGGRGESRGSFGVSTQPAAQNTQISSTRRGFSPTSASLQNYIDLFLTVPSKAELSEWRVEVLDPAQKPVAVWSGGREDLPESVRWEGLDPSGSPVAQGLYSTRLLTRYGSVYKDALVTGPSISLVIDPPSGSVMVEPSPVSLAKLGPLTPLRFVVQAKSLLAFIATWDLEIVDASGRVLASSHANWPNSRFEWDGRDPEGGLLAPGASYEAIARVEDEYGNVGVLRGEFRSEALPTAEEKSSLVADAPGLAPKGDGSHPSIGLAPTIGQAEAVQAWKVAVVDAAEQTVRSWSGDGQALPGPLSWDGSTDSGELAPDGDYKALLEVNYGLAYAPVRTESAPFLLASGQPRVGLELSTSLLSPDGDGENESVTISLSAEGSAAPLSSWTLDILDPAGNSFASFKGSWPPEPLAWNGRGRDGSLVESATDYLVKAQVRDALGNLGSAELRLGTDLLVEKVAGGYRIRISSIVFRSYTADWLGVPSERAQRNLATLDLLAERLAKFPGYRILLEGHAVMINWNDRAKGEAEQLSILIPLSLSRAKAVAEALVGRGIAPGRLEARGLGALDPVVPDSDLANRWKNRRVDFYLIK